VDNITHTTGFVVAAWSPSLGQVMTGSPAETLIRIAATRGAANTALAQARWQ
jgi:hypothetical protein